MEPHPLGGAITISTSRDSAGMDHLVVAGQKTAEPAANQAPPVVFIVHKPANPEWNPVDNLRLTVE